MGVPSEFRWGLALLPCFWHFQVPGNAPGLPATPLTSQSRTPQTDTHLHTSPLPSILVSRLFHKLSSYFISRSEHQIVFRSLFLWFDVLGPATVTGPAKPYPTVVSTGILLSSSAACPSSVQHGGTEYCLATCHPPAGFPARQLGFTLFTYIPSFAEYYSSRACHQCPSQSGILVLNTTKKPRL